MLTLLWLSLSGQFLGPENQRQGWSTESQPQGPHSPVSRKESDKLVFVTQYCDASDN